MEDFIVQNIGKSSVPEVIGAAEECAKQNPDKLIMAVGNEEDSIVFALYAGGHGDVHATEWLYATNLISRAFDSEKYNTDEDGRIAVGNFKSSDVPGDLEKLRERAEAFLQTRL